MTEEDKRLIWKTVTQINESVKCDIRIMEVCVTEPNYIISSIGILCRQITGEFPSQYIGYREST